MTTSSRSATSTRDLRTWISELEAASELIRVDKNVDPLTQMGALLYQCREKALFFEKLPHGWRSLGQAPANVRQAALAFGVPEEKLIPHVAAMLGTRIAPVMVESGPVKDVKLKRGEFDLTQLPVHVAGQRDGGPVIGSGLMVTKDPDTGKRNFSFHRLQIKGPNKSGILLYPRHSWKNYLKYQEKNQPMPQGQRKNMARDDAQKMQQVRQNLVKINQEIVQARKSREHPPVAPEAQLERARRNEKIVEQKKKESVLQKLIKSRQGSKEAMQRASG